MRQLQFLKRVTCSKRFQSSAAASVSAGNAHNMSLDLDFVLGLLDSSAKGPENNTANSLSWTRMKFRETEKETEGKTTNSGSFEDFSSFFAPLNPQTSSSSESTLTRLQNLADSLPTQIYDKNGNLIPLNTSQPPMSFFEIDTTLAAATTTTTSVNTKVVPIFHRDNVDWSTVTLTSILKKIVPEEAFLEQPTETLVENDNENSVNTMVTVETKERVQEQNITFNHVELRLLDRDQLTSLAKHFNVSIEQSDYKIEQELLTTAFKFSAKRNATKNSVSKEKISWTEENEALLLKLYEETRAEKQKVDQKLLQLLNNNNTACIITSAPSLKRGHGASDRGLWAVLTDQFRQAAKFHVSVSECRNKLIILKRLKTH